MSSSTTFEPFLLHSLYHSLIWLPLGCPNRVQRKPFPLCNVSALTIGNHTLPIAVCRGPLILVSLTQSCVTQPQGRDLRSESSGDLVTVLTPWHALTQTISHPGRAGEHVAPGPQACAACTVLDVVGDYNTMVSIRVPKHIET